MKFSKPWFRKQNQTWYVTLNGKQHNLGRDKDQAFDKYARLLHQRHQPESNVRRLLNRYWDWVQKNRAATTCAKMRPRLESFGGFISATLTTKQLKPHHVQDWLDARFPNANPTYRNTLITTIKGAMNWAAGLGIIESSPIAAMRKPPVKIRQEFIAAPDWPTILDAARDTDFRELLTVMFSSGCRVEEIIDMEAHHYQSGRIVFPIDESKGRRRSRVIYLPAEAQEIIERRAQTPGFLFRNNKGNKWTSDAINCRFARMRRKLGIKRLCGTMLRHSFAHYRLTNGQDSMVVAKLMGHADGRMLATRYGHLEQNSGFMQNEADRVRIPTKSEQADPSSPERRSA